MTTFSQPTAHIILSMATFSQPTAHIGALLRVHHDIAYALDGNCCARYIGSVWYHWPSDTFQSFGIFHWRYQRCSAVVSIVSHDRTQCVAIWSVQSDDIKLRFGAPQGSVLGPKLYCIFAKPVGENCRRHGMSYHSYADDTQIYQDIKPQVDLSERWERCSSDIADWMSVKTELII